MNDHVKDYLDRAIASFVGDPADSDYLHGYLAALETVRDDLFLTSAERAKRNKAYSLTKPKRRSIGL